MRRLGVVIAAVALGGCFDSLVGGDCRPGWIAVGGECQPDVDDPDAGSRPDADVDADPDAAACAVGATWCGACVDLATDPDHCGACGVTCGSGICAANACVGAAAGHVVLIGHDYRVHHAAAARLLANATTLGGAATPRIALSAASGDDDGEAAVRVALTTGLAAAGHGWLPVVIAGGAPLERSTVDVLIILPRFAAPAASLAEGQAWGAGLAGFVAAGGTVIGLDSPGGTTVDVLRGAGVSTATSGAPATGGLVTIAAPGDALAVGVPSPYLGERGTTTFTVDVSAGTVVARSAGAAVAIHLATPGP
jgi:hypothetical protein